MENVDYTKQLYLYDDRSKYGYFFKVKDIVFEDDTCLLCSVTIIGSSEYLEENDKILINKLTREVKNSDYDSWLVTSDGQWIEQEVKELEDRYNSSYKKMFMDNFLK